MGVLRKDQLRLIAADHFVVRFFKESILFRGVMVPLPSEHPAKIDRVIFGKAVCIEIYIILFDPDRFGLFIEHKTGR